jgi:dTMP kinase
MRGAFVSFEGGEGAGKTTQIKLLAERLKALGRDVVVTREPGGTHGAEAIRELILNSSGFNFSSMTETLLFFAARRDHVEKVILPAQLRGAIVLCDRFVDSTYAYQSALGNVEQHVIQELASLVLGKLKPDLTFILDIEPELGLKRASLRRGAGATDRFEAESLEFHTRIRARFLAIAENEPVRCVVLSGNQEADVLAHQVLDMFLQRLEAK